MDPFFPRARLGGACGPPISPPLVCSAPCTPESMKLHRYIAPLVSIVFGRSSFSPFLSSPEHALQTLLLISSLYGIEELFTHGHHGVPNKQCLFHLLLRRHWSVLHLQVPTCFGSRCETDWLTYLGGGLFGFDISSMSGVLGTEAYKRYFHHPRSYGQGAITAAMPFGSLVGALSSSFIADRYSRRTAIQIASVIWIIGSM